MQNDDHADIDIVFVKFACGSGNWYNDFESSLYAQKCTYSTLKVSLFGTSNSTSRN